jgi:hypothetical protein
MSTALGQGLGPLELDPDLDLISARLGLKGTGLPSPEEEVREGQAGQERDRRQKVA